MFALLVLALVAGTWAQVPTTCPGPKQFEGRFRRFERDGSNRISQEGFIAYDETQRRVRAFDDIKEKEGELVYDVLTLYDLNVEYIVDRKTKKCNVTQPREHFRPIGVPPDAKYLWEGVIGLAGQPGEHVVVATFGAKAEEYEYEVTVTYPDCFPVNQRYRTKEGKESNTDFYDLQNGISNPDLFFPPEECNSP